MSRTGTAAGVLEDVLGHVRSVQLPPPLVPGYRVRQYSHRRAAFLRRDLLASDDLAQLPRYPGTREEHGAWPNAGSVHADLLYDAPGRLQEEYRALWGKPARPSSEGREVGEVATGIAAPT